MRRLLTGAVAIAIFAAGAEAQETSGTAAPCRDAAVLLSESEQQYCFAVAQAAESAQPQIGILLAGGNPTLGNTGTGAIRLGTLPRFSATAKLSAVWIQIPDIEQQGTAATGKLSLPAPALSGAAAIGLFPGISVAPTLGGFGSVDLLGSATWLPFSVIGVDGFDEAPDFAYGIGARIGILRESFTAPGIALSVMRRSLGRIRYGNVCRAGAGSNLLAGEGDGYRLEGGVCAAAGDRGEFTFDLTNWSGRATVSKRLLGFGITAGAGYDRFESDLGLGVGASAQLPEIGARPVFVRASEIQVETDRWSTFVNAAFSVLLARFVAEVGWMGGGSIVPGFQASNSEFDPGSGTLFGSVGVNVGL